MEEKVNAILATEQENQKILLRIENHLNDIDESLSKDRGGIQDLNIKVGSLVGEMGELRRSVNVNAERTRDRVAEVVEPVISSNAELGHKFEKAKKKDLIFVTEPKKWWHKLFGK